MRGDQQNAAVHVLTRGVRDEDPDGRGFFLEELLQAVDIVIGFVDFDADQRSLLAKDDIDFHVFLTPIKHFHRRTMLLQVRNR